MQFRLDRSRSSGRIATCASSATTTSRSTAGAGPRCSTSSASSSTFPARRSSGWRTTTAARTTILAAGQPAGRSTTASGTTRRCVAAQDAARRRRGSCEFPTSRRKPKAVVARDQVPRSSRRASPPRDFAILFRTNEQPRLFETGAAAAQACRTCWSAGSRSSTARKSATCWRICKADRASRRRSVAAADHQRAGPRHRRRSRSTSCSTRAVKQRHARCGTSCPTALAAKEITAKTAQCARQVSAAGRRLPPPQPAAGRRSGRAARTTGWRRSTTTWKSAGSTRSRPSRRPAGPCSTNAGRRCAEYQSRANRPSLAEFLERNGAHRPRRRLRRER